MRDEEYNEWKKLISADHIEKASRYIRRLSIALRISFQVKFIQTLQQDQRKEVLSDLQQETNNWKNWELLYKDFLAESKRVNATFLLHYEMMEHCEEVSALSLAERIGGHQGYNLMLASVKLSLPFAFLNGASSYAAYTTQLLYEHCKCGVFYQNMKESLFTAPHKDSTLNFGLDTQREMDHRDALKAFRSGATMSSVMPRMSLIDSLNEAHDHSSKNRDYRNREKH
ncbi:unnamed protein product [Mytilus edulis]|uniref:Uncharacterized protein n=1 Tax=Mytilus edulis TaxID=6550 RepID=A0A8S3V879_MYTED|nr:unnamed protein product [Mytilus edulis]